MSKMLKQETQETKILDLHFSVGGPLLPEYTRLIKHEKYGFFYRDLVAELPFILMHPKPEQEDLNTLVLERSPSKNAADRMKQEGSQDNAEVPTQNLIQLDGDDDCKDDDIIFEDFARLRLKGAETES